MKLALVKLKLVGHNCSLDEYEAYQAQVGWWIRFKHRWYNLILVSERSRAAKQLFRSSAARFAEKERHHLSKNHYIVHPLSDFRLFWQMLMIAVFGVMLAFVPYMHAMFIFGHGETENFEGYFRLLYVLTALDLCCMIDIVMNFFTGYLVKANKEVVLDQKRIACTYLRTFFIVDLLSSLPIDFSVLTYDSNITWNTYHSVFNAVVIVLAYLKILRVVSFLKYVQDVCKAFGLHLFKYRILHMLLVFGVLLQWTACTLYLIPYAIHGEQLTNKSSPEYGSSWMHHYKMHNESQIRKLRVSIARSLSNMLTTGPCIATRDYFWEDLLDRPLLVFLGRIFNAYVLASVYLMTSTNVDTQSKYCLMMDQLESFMYHRKFTGKLKDRLRAYFQYRYQKRYYREHNILSAMPDLLRHEMNMVTCRRMVESVMIFKHQPRHVISNIVAVMKREVFLKNDVIFKYNTPGNCMYFLASGRVAVYLPINEAELSYYKETYHMVDGDHFGEVALIEDHGLRTMTTVAVETSDCYRLDREDFNSCVTKHYEIYKRIAHVAEERTLQSNDLLGVQLKGAGGTWDQDPNSSLM